MLETIDKRIGLLHRNLPAIITIAETFQEMEDVDKLFWESIEIFLATQIQSVPVSHQNVDQLINITELFHKHTGGKLDAKYSEALCKYLVKALKDESL